VSSNLALMQTSDGSTPYRYPFEFRVVGEVRVRAREDEVGAEAESLITCERVVECFCRTRVYEQEREETSKPPLGGRRAV
jgi:hypothetical protein